MEIKNYINLYFITIFLITKMEITYQERESYVNVSILALEEDLARRNGQPSPEMKEMAKFLITNGGVIFTQKQLDVIGKILTEEEMVELGDRLMARSEKMRKLEKSTKELEKLLLESKLAQATWDLEDLEISEERKNKI
jgi:hypothetical protein